ncbi:HNH endonuclease [Candidatus Thiosymbion oneisti]|uniref:HNH endonuclease n=1 Tax=Candidatus Thiosymbion oneisti TaxID=589554 RepID=UPI000A7C383A|nr:HNH endonuclease [Candidatus Thiosymbion oneisti]
MRPVRRGRSPRPNDFEPYPDAKPALISRLGGYCSYCERRIATNLAVEHIQPKNLPAYIHLEGRWENFLLGCVNCNSTKSDKDVLLDHILLPDRDNTFLAFTYSPDGTVSPSAAAARHGITRQAEDTLALTGLDKRISAVFDENGKRVSIDRVSQRLEVWAVAEEASADLSNQPDNKDIRRIIVQAALGYGFFSIWMTIFKDDSDMRNRLIDAFPGTRESGCFDPADVRPVSPAPNPDDLAGGGKI